MTRGRKLFIFGMMAFGQFMALVDIQIVAASLNAIQAGLSAGPDEISWVQTAYLMAELVMIPLAGLLAKALSTRWLFAASAGLFTLASALCGLAWDIDSMIAFRAFQGFVGGAMVPTVWATGFILFTGRDRALASAILGVVTMLAPVSGPTIGGWITEWIGWRWIFYINIVPGIAVAILSAALIRFDHARPALLRSMDWTHLLAMALFLGCLDVVLEEGPRHGWFGDTGIATAAWVALVAFVLFVERCLRSAAPVVRLTPFRRPTFVLASAIGLATSAAIFAATYLVPVFLGRVRGHTSFDIGTTVCVTGLGMLVSAPLTMRLLKHCDPRTVIALGVLVFTASLWMFSSIGPEWGFRELFWPHVLRGVAGMLCVVPAANLALGDLEDEAMHEASGLFNLLRNLGGALGIALVNTWLQDHTRLHALRLGEALGANGGAARAMLADLLQRMQAQTTDTALALQAAHAMLERHVQRQALVLAFDDVFRLMAWLLLATLVLVPWCRPAIRSTSTTPPEP
ncbi:MAG: DHA2 family efflux MFS transporter permease subunit [Duganella sp.]